MLKACALHCQKNRVDIVLGRVNRFVGDEESETKIFATDQIAGLSRHSQPFAGQQVSLEQLPGKEWIVSEQGEAANSGLEASFLLNHEPQPRSNDMANMSKCRRPVRERI